jgi:hypothetical protein
MALKSGNLLAIVALLLAGIALPGCSFNDAGFQNDYVAAETGTGCVSVTSKLIANTVFASRTCRTRDGIVADDCQFYQCYGMHATAPIGVCARQRICRTR